MTEDDHLSARSDPATTQPGDPEKTGYCNPPKKYQFQKGHKGFPRKKAPSTSLHEHVQEALDEIVVYREGGKTKKATNGKLIVQTAVRSAARGDHRARGDIIKLSSLSRQTHHRRPEPKQITPDMTDKEAVELLMAQIRADKL